MDYNGTNFTSCSKLRDAAAITNDGEYFLGRINSAIVLGQDWSELPQSQHPRASFGTVWQTIHGEKWTERKPEGLYDPESYSACHPLFAEETYVPWLTQQKRENVEYRSKRENTEYAQDIHPSRQILLHQDSVLYTIHCKSVCGRTLRVGFVCLLDLCDL